MNLKFLIMAGLGYYFYNDIKKKYAAAMNDRNALINMLTSEQKDLLIKGINTIAETSKTVIQPIQ